VFCVPQALHRKELRVQSEVWYGIAQEGDFLEDMRQWKNNKEGDLMGLYGLDYCGLS